MARDLTALFEPDGVAIVGASDDPVKWGNWLARGALRGEHRRPVYLVNRRAAEVMGGPGTDRWASCPDAPGWPCWRCRRRRWSRLSTRRSAPGCGRSS